MMYIIIYYIFILYRLSQLIFNVYLVIFYMIYAFTIILKNNYINYTIKQ